MTDLDFLREYQPAIINTPKMGLVKFDLEAHKLPLSTIKKSEYQLRSSLLETLDERIIDRVREARKRFFTDNVKKFVPLLSIPEIEAPRLIRVPEFPNINRIYPKLSDGELKKMKELDREVAYGFLGPLTAYVKDLGNVIRKGIDSGSPADFAVSLTKEKFDNVVGDFVGYVSEETSNIFDRGLKLLDKFLPKKSNPEKLEYAVTFGNPVYAVAVQTNKFYLSAGPTSQYVEKALKDVGSIKFDDIIDSPAPDKEKRLAVAKLDKVLKIAGSYLSV